MPNPFSIPDVKDMSLGQLRILGRELNSKRETVLADYKKSASQIQSAIVGREKIEIAQRKASDPNYDKKVQVVGKKLPSRSSRQS